MLICTVPGVVYTLASSVQTLLLPTSLPVSVVDLSMTVALTGVRWNPVCLGLDLSDGRWDRTFSHRFVYWSFVFHLLHIFFNIFIFSRIAGEPTQILAHVRPSTLPLSFISSLGQSGLAQEPQFRAFWAAPALCISFLATASIPYSPETDLCSPDCLWQCLWGAQQAQVKLLTESGQQREVGDRYRDC